MRSGRSAGALTGASRFYPKFGAVKGRDPGQTGSTPFSAPGPTECVSYTASGVRNARYGTAPPGNAQKAQQFDLAILTSRGHGARYGEASGGARQPPRGRHVTFVANSAMAMIARHNAQVLARLEGR